MHLCLENIKILNAKYEKNDNVMLSLLLRKNDTQSTTKFYLEM